MSTAVINKDKENIFEKYPKCLPVINKDNKVYWPGVPRCLAAD